MFQGEERVQDINSKYSRFEEDILVKLQNLYVKKFRMDRFDSIAISLFV